MCALDVGYFIEILMNFFFHINEIFTILLLGKKSYAGTFCVYSQGI